MKWITMETTDDEREQFKKDWKILARRLKGSKPKGQKEFDAFKKESNHLEYDFDVGDLVFCDGELYTISNIDEDGTIDLDNDDGSVMGVRTEELKLYRKKPNPRDVKRKMATKMKFKVGDKVRYKNPESESIPEDFYGVFTVTDCFRDDWGDPMYTIENPDSSNGVFEDDIELASSKAMSESSEATCDLCGAEGHEDDFEIVPGYGFVCHDCQQEIKKHGGAKGEPISSDTIRGITDEQIDESWLGDKLASAGKWLGQKTGDAATGAAKMTGKAAAATGKAVGKAAAATGKAAGKAAAATGKALGKAAVATGKAAGKAAAATGKAVGKAALATGKAAGKAALKGGKVVGKAAGKAAVATGKAAGKAAVATGKAAGKAIKRGTSKLYDKFVNGNNTGVLKKGEDVVIAND